MKKMAGAWRHRVQQKQNLFRFIEEMREKADEKGKNTIRGGYKW